MNDETSREPARDPQDLERLLIARQWVGDVDGMAALFEPDAVVDGGEGQLTRGRQAIRALFAEITATGRKFASGDRRPAVINGDLALTSTKLPDGTITTEVARRQSDETWLWVIDRFSVA
ncbi:nuclear transport factor 2 family protein [Mesorhizobium sp. AR10]|uniref:YybH family protein n=1 Tax=Mesorhizobium sp. AR10 TaxID=2865839 RepID=UPI002160D867|nr:nuclear transport factor 2 family protein [Mesorhizobium sp. AR10]UVK40739.1 nuclear transport factor 2 family protein [Mesorhizobium sp. AR10]